jgi:hypothetical protein
MRGPTRGAIWGPPPAFEEADFLELLRPLLEPMLAAVKERRPSAEVGSTDFIVCPSVVIDVFPDLETRRLGVAADVLIPLR